MYELTPDEFPLAAPLCADLPHHRVIVFSVLEGSCPGRVFVDDRAAPRAALVASLTEFFCFAGDAGNPDFNHVLQEQVVPGLLAQMSTAAFSGPTPAWHKVIDQLLESVPGGWAQRAEFNFPEESFVPLSAWRASIPPGLRVAAYNREMAARFPELEPLWNGIDQFLAFGFGFYVAREDEVLCHCHTVAVGGGLAELSVETEPASRRQGLARLAVSAFIEHSLHAGLTPHWTCWRINQPSVALAERLGFVHAQDAPVRYVQPDG